MSRSITMLLRIHLGFLTSNETSDLNILSSIQRQFIQSLPKDSQSSLPSVVAWSSRPLIMASHFYLRAPSSSDTRSHNVEVQKNRTLSPKLASPAPSTAQRSHATINPNPKPSTQLPSSYTTDHWAWSMSDPSFRASDLATLPWDELDDTFLFPMISVKEPSIPAAEIITEPADIISSDDDTASMTSSSASGPKAVVTHDARPKAPRAQSYAQSKAVKAQVDPKRSASITISMIKSVRRARKQQQAQRAQDAYKQRKVSELLTLRRQVADLTQRLTMMMANRCTACRLGLIDCGLSRTAESGKEQTIDAPQITPRDNEREYEIEGRIKRLTRQAELLSF